MGLEDASALAELVLAGHGPADDLFDLFDERRFDRVRAVTRASVQVAEVLRDRLDPAGLPALMADTTALVSTAP